MDAISGRTTGLGGLALENKNYNSAYIYTGLVPAPRCGTALFFNNSGYSPDQLNKLPLFESFFFKETIYIYIRGKFYPRAKRQSFTLLCLMNLFIEINL
jgi:hypothetical protein